MSEPYRTPCQLCQGARIIRRLFGHAPIPCPWCNGSDPTTPAAQEMHEQQDEQWARAA